MISVVIPTYNEAEIIASTIDHLLNTLDREQIKEILVADGGSIDGTQEIAASSGANVISCKVKGRAAQMNAGAAAATGSILYFLHADSIPEAGYSKKIIASLKNGAVAGCFRLRFDVNHWFLKFNAWFTRFDIDSIRFGDQSLFVVKDSFHQTGGFNEKQILLEDQEIIKRLKRYGSFKVLNGYVITSARKYKVNGIYKTQSIYYLIYFLYRSGMDQQQLVKIYKRLISQNKI